MPSTDLHTHTLCLCVCVWGGGGGGEASCGPCSAKDTDRGFA